MMKQLFESSQLFGSNAPFIEELYENYLDNPDSVSDEWRTYFDALQNTPGNGRDVAHYPIINAFADMAKRGPVRTVVASGADQKQVSVLQLINAHRFLGTRWAQLDPLKRTERPEIHELELSHYGFTEADLNETFNTGSFHGLPGDRATLREILDAVRQTYCGSIGAEYMYMTDIGEKRWIQARLEPTRGRPTFDNQKQRRILERLTAAETMERYLHTKYVGQKRFSLEGGESTIVAMDELIRVAGSKGVQEIVIGMAHRGRLNVLVNTLGKSPSMLFSEFEGKAASDLSAGDVKYHMGFSSDVMTAGGPVHLTLAFNPSHLEIVNPVVEGSVYARQTRRGENGKSEVVPVIIHGDAAVAGQGVNQEMLNFAQTRGYGTGGTVSGVARVLRRERPETKIILSEPANAQLVGSGIVQERSADGGPSATHPAFEPHPIQGWTPDFVPAVLDRTVFDDNIAIDDVTARDTARLLAHQEGIFVGISAGATFAAALEVARNASPGSVILAMLPDTGERYLSAPLFDDIPADMTDDELAISLSTPGYHL